MWHEQEKGLGLPQLSCLRVPWMFPLSCGCVSAFSVCDATARMIYIVPNRFLELEHTCQEADLQVVLRLTRNGSRPRAHKCWLVHKRRVSRRCAGRAYHKDSQVQHSTFKNLTSRSRNSHVSVIKCSRTRMCSVIEIANCFCMVDPNQRQLEMGTVCSTTYVLNRCLAIENRMKILVTVPTAEGPTLFSICSYLQLRTCLTPCCPCCNRFTSLSVRLIALTPA